MARKSKPQANDSPEASGAISDAGAKGVRKALKSLGAEGGEVPGPSTNPATNLLIHDIVMRVGGRLMRQTVEKGVLTNRYGGSDAKRIIENRTLGQALVGSLVARVATRSVPGAVVVGGGLALKTLYDRGRKRRSARRSGDRMLKDMGQD